MTPPIAPGEAVTRKQAIEAIQQEMYAAIVANQALGRPVSGVCATIAMRHIEAMRSDCAAACDLFASKNASQSSLYVSGRFWGGIECATAIRALPLTAPTPDQGEG